MILSEKGGFTVRSTVGTVSGTDVLPDGGASEEDRHSLWNASPTHT